LALFPFILSNYLPFGAVVIGITIGMFIGNLFKLPENKEAKLYWWEV